jgi:hypothetical protein
LSSFAEGGGFTVGVAVAVVVAIAVASRYAKPLGLALSDLSTEGGFSPWGMLTYPLPNNKAS